MLKEQTSASLKKKKKKVIFSLTKEGHVLITCLHMTGRVTVPKLPLYVLFLTEVEHVLDQRMSEKIGPLHPLVRDEFF